MSYLIASFIVLWILYSVSDHIGNGDCRSTTGFESDLEWLCERCNVITLTWGFMQGHATGDSGDRIVIKKSFPECIAIAGRHGFVPATNNDNMVTLVRTNKKDFTHIHQENAKRAEEQRRSEEMLRQAEEELNYTEWYDEPEDGKKKPFLIIGIAAIIIAITCAMFNGIDTAFSVSERRTAEEVIIPADTSVHKIEVVKPVTPVKSKVVAKKNKNKTAKNVTLDGGSTEEIIVVEEKPEVMPADKIFDVVEEMPIFPGGSSALFEYISKNQHYPVVAEENGVQGRVVVTFVVECDGSITNVKVVKSADPSLDYEARRVVSSMPHWIPAKQNGTAVRCKYTVPVTFRLT